MKKLFIIFLLVMGILFLAGSPIMAQPPSPTVVFLNFDSDVDMDDVAIFQAALGSQEGDPNYNPDADFDDDGRITMNNYRILRSLSTGS